MTKAATAQMQTALFRACKQIFKKIKRDIQDHKIIIISNTVSSKVDCSFCEDLSIPANDDFGIQGRAAMQKVRDVSTEKFRKTN